jgi:hypothetical protein
LLSVWDFLAIPFHLRDSSPVDRDFCVSSPFSWLKKTPHNMAILVNPFTHPSHMIADKYKKLYAKRENIWKLVNNIDRAWKNLDRANLKELR